MGTIADFVQLSVPEDACQSQYVRRSLVNYFENVVTLDSHVNPIGLPIGLYVHYAHPSSAVSGYGRVDPEDTKRVGRTVRDDPAFVLVGPYWLNTSRILRVCVHRDRAWLSLNFVDGQRLEPHHDRIPVILDALLGFKPPEIGEPRDQVKEAMGPSPLQAGAREPESSARVQEGIAHVLAFKKKLDAMSDLEFLACRLPEAKSTTGQGAAVSSPLLVCEAEHSPQVPAVGRFTWGLYDTHSEGRPHHTALLCQRCLDALWKDLHGLVVTQKAHFAASRVTGTGRDGYEQRES
jgi:hypothetical protein